VPHPIANHLYKLFDDWRGLRQFLLRGVENVRTKRTMICMARNHTKLSKAA
jgi:hypothetical protein